VAASTGAAAATSMSSRTALLALVLHKLCIFASAASVTTAA
jgi:hypothetical protein